MPRGYALCQLQEGQAEMIYTVPADSGSTFSANLGSGSGSSSGRTSTSEAVGRAAAAAAKAAVAADAAGVPERYTGRSRKAISSEYRVRLVVTLNAVTSMLEELEDKSSGLEAFPSRHLLNEWRTRAIKTLAGVDALSAKGWTAAEAFTRADEASSAFEEASKAKKRKRGDDRDPGQEMAEELDLDLELA